MRWLTGGRGGRRHLLGRWAREALTPPTARDVQWNMEPLQVRCELPTLNTIAKRHNGSRSNMILFHFVKRKIKYHTMQWRGHVDAIN